MKTTTFVASAKQWNGGKPDKNGLDSVVLIPFGGTAPRGLNVICGSNAQMQGFAENKCYIVTATERPFEEEHGRQFNFTSIAEVNPFDALSFGSANPTKVLIEKEVEGVKESAKKNPAVEV